MLQGEKGGSELTTLFCSLGAADEAARVGRVGVEENQEQLPGLAAEAGGRSIPHSHAAHPWRTWLIAKPNSREALKFKV